MFFGLRLLIGELSGTIRALISSRPGTGKQTNETLLSSSFEKCNVSFVNSRGSGRKWTQPTPEGRRIHKSTIPTSTRANEESGWKHFPLSHSSFLSSPAVWSSFPLSILTMDSRITPMKVLRAGVVNKVSSMGYFCHCQTGVIIYIGLCKSKELAVSTEHTPFLLSRQAVKRK